MNTNNLLRGLNILNACLVFVFSICVGTSSGQEADSKKGNLFRNGDFQSNLNEWTLRSIAGPAGTMKIDSEVKHSNLPSLRVENSQPSDTVVTQKVKVKPNTRYRMIAFVKTKDVTPVKRGGKEGASLAVYGQYIKTESVQKTKVWTRVTHEFSTGGETEIEIGPRLGHSGNFVSGVAWFADLTLLEIGKAR